MNQYECAKRWASDKRKPEGRAGRSMFYEGDTIYSWGHHWPLARRVTLSDSGRTVALLHDRSYTPSTNRHRRQVARVLGYRYEYVSHDYFGDVTDEASLAHAKHRTVEDDKDRAYEARIARNERAKREREYNADNARSQLEDLLDVEFDEMSGSACIKLRNLLLGVPDNNFQCGGYRRAGERRGGLAQQYPVLAETIAAVIGQDPTVLKRPGELLTLITNFKLLAA
jgi:hypothetical protein